MDPLCTRRGCRQPHPGAPRLLHTDLSHCAVSRASHIVLVLQEADVEMKFELQEVPCKKCLKDKRGRKMIRKGKLSDLPFRSNNVK